MTIDKSFTAYVEELLAGFGPVRVKPMFGVVAVYADELMFAIIAGDGLYLRVDEETEPRFRDAGSEPFVYKTRDGREIVMSYWRAPESALESPDDVEPWARLSLEAALRKRASKGKKRKG